jgi:hypothetical protein
MIRLKSIVHPETDRVLWMMRQAGWSDTQIGVAKEKDNA